MIMTETKNNFLAGEWLAGDTSVENRNPSDLSDVIGHFAQASSSQLTKALDAARLLHLELDDHKALHEEYATFLDALQFP